MPDRVALLALPASGNVRVVPWALTTDRPPTAMRQRCMEVAQTTWAAALVAEPTRGAR